MCRKVFEVWLLVMFLHVRAECAPAQYAFQVSFTDKHNTTYSITSPLAFLSPRSLARRATQGIAIDTTDLPVNRNYVDSVLTLTGGKLHNTSRWLNLCTILISDSTQILNLNGRSFISGIKLVGYYPAGLHRSARAQQMVNTPPAKRATSGGLPYYGLTWTQTQLVNGNYLHDNGYKGQGKIIAVLDAGFAGTDTHHGFDSLWLSGGIVDTFNFAYDNGNVFSQDNHGTEVLSTMAGNVPGTFIGCAPQAKFALYLTDYEPGDQPLEMNNMMSAAERADSLGADVITESLGYDLFDYPSTAGLFFSLDMDGNTTVAAKAANIATKKGMLFVATAGNDGIPVPGWGNHVLTPGDADSALTIGAVDGLGNIAGYSGYGPNGAGQVKPDVCGMGTSAYSFDVATGGYATPSGTSISTPQIAGWAACLWQAHPMATPFQLRQAIIKCANSYSNPGSQNGYGVPDFQCTTQILAVKDTPPPFSPGNWVIITPNPFHDILKLAVSPDTDQNVDFRIMDLTGKVYLSWTTYLFKGLNVPITVSVPEMPPGMYLLKAVSPTQQQIVKLVKR